MLRNVLMSLALLTPALALAALAPARTPAEKVKAAEVADKFFDSGKVVEISFDIGPKEMDSLRREHRKYVRATLKEGGRTYKDVGIHLRGAAGSFRGIDDKPGLTVNMDKFTDDQRFHGLDKFHLANSVQDPSYVAELLCGEMSRAAGVPASRVTHAVVTINGRKRGLYYLKEGYDGAFLKRHFGGKDGHLYDGGFLRDLDQPLQLLSGKEAAKPHADLRALVAAANERDAKKRFEKMDKLLDTEKFISYLALEVFTWDWDGYPMNRNNYRIYHDTKRDKLIFIPSGMDQMFGNPGGPLVPNFQGLVARALMETPEGRERYLARMRELMKDVFRPEALGKRLDELQARIQPELARIDAGAGRDFPNQIRRLRDGITQRARSLDQQLKQTKK
jgi:spore coat protein H